MLKIYFIVFSLFCICSCSGTGGLNHLKEDRVEVCHGLGCRTGIFQDNSLRTHKPTKDERLRIQQGLAPDFGSDLFLISDSAD